MSAFWARVIIEPVLENGELIGFAKVTRDITHEHEADVGLAMANRNLEIALTHMCQGLVLYDPEGRLMLANQRLTEMFAVSADRIRIGMSLPDVMAGLGFSRHRSKKMQNRIHALGSSGRLYHSIEESKCGCIVSVSTRRIADGGWVTTFEDVTERRKAQDQIDYLAHHDTLTSLPNRILFRKRFKDALAQIKRGVPFAVFILDIKDFSRVNETLGLTAGDELLRSFACRMKDQIREVDTIARLDGDEFAILQYKPELPRDTEALASRLVESCLLPYQIGGESVIANLNIGIALGGRDGDDEDELLTKADLALWRAKKSALPSYNFFDPEMDRELQSRRSMERDLPRSHRA